jgi:hypothetical protein
LKRRARKPVQEIWWQGHSAQTRFPHAKQKEPSNLILGGLCPSGPVGIFMRARLGAILWIHILLNGWVDGPGKTGIVRWGVLASVNVRSGECRGAAESRTKIYVTVTSRDPREKIQTEDVSRDLINGGYKIYPSIPFIFTKVSESVLAEISIYRAMRSETLQRLPHRPGISHISVAVP